MNHLLKYLAIIAAVLGAATGAQAQNDAQFSQYYEIPTLYNPAAAGQTDFIRIRGAGRLQWVGIDGAPKTFMLSGDMPFKLFGRRFGTGLVMQQESIGLYKSLNINAQIGFKLKKFGGEFTFALQPGMYDQHFRGSEVFIPDGDDYHQSSDEGLPATDLHGTTFDIGAGIWYSHRRWWAGISGSHLTSPTIKMGGENGGQGNDENIYEFKADRTLYFMAGGNIPLKNTLFEILPSVLVKSDFSFTTAEVTARTRYNKFLSFGIGYRYNDAVYATVAAEIKNFYIGYSYDYATTGIRSASSGSHEITVGYSLKLDLGDKNRNKHRSIRIM